MRSTRFQRKHFNYSTILTLSALVFSLIKSQQIKDKSEANKEISDGLKESFKKQFGISVIQKLLELTKSVEDNLVDEKMDICCHILRDLVESLEDCRAVSGSSITLD